MTSRNSFSNEMQTSSSSGSTRVEEGGRQKQDKFEFLKELTSSSKHLKKTFYEHLFNVYSYLKEQGLPADIYNAGLFHSVYGTEFYEFQNDRITRDVVRGYIGEYAEELVFTFCSFKKDRFNNLVNNTRGWSKQQHLDLCYIEYSNVWDQREHRHADGYLEILEKTMARLKEP